MAEKTAGSGRERQRRRTRKAIIDAAVELLRRGDNPSVAEIAEAADVSRRTVYLYFPTHEHLLADAALEASRATVEPRFEASGDAAERVEALVRAVQQGFAETEQLGRTIIRLTVGAPRTNAPGAGPRRGYRRVEWIERALEPLPGDAAAGALRAARLRARARDRLGVDDRARGHPRPQPGGGGRSLRLGGTHAARGRDVARRITRCG